MSLLLLTRKRRIGIESVLLEQTLADSNAANWGDSVISLAMAGEFIQSLADDLNNWLDAISAIAGGNIITNGLVLFLKLDEGSGEILTDSSVAGNHGQRGSSSGSDTNDPTWDGDGLVFDGLDNYCTIPFILNPSVTDLTLFIAFKIDTGVAVTPQLFSQQDGSGTGRPWLLLDASADAISSVLGGTSPSHIHSTTLSDESDHVGVIRKSGTTMSLFLNGANKVDATKTAESATGQYILGAAKSTTGGFHNRNIYCVLLYNTALSDADIALNHAAIKAYLLAEKGITVP